MLNLSSLIKSLKLQPINGVSGESKSSVDIFRTRSDESFLVFLVPFELELGAVFSLEFFDSSFLLRFVPFWLLMAALRRFDDVRPNFESGLA